MKNLEISFQQESAKYPIILKGTWWVWNVEFQCYENSGVPAVGDKGEQGLQGLIGNTGPQGPAGVVE